MNPAVDSPRFKACAASIRGRRETNQDGHLLLDLPGDAHLYAVADGMGGAVDGGIASSLVLDAAKRVAIGRFPNTDGQISLKAVLAEVFEQAQAELAAYLQSHPGSKGMGTTLACVLACGDRFAVASIGDSRVYLLRAGLAQQITRDHTYTEDYRMRMGAAADERILSRYANAITRCIDGGSDVPDLFPVSDDVFPLEAGDGIVLCSDGLILSKVSTDAGFIATYVQGTRSVESAARNLVSYAFHEGSQDNITVLVAEWGSIPRTGNVVPTHLHYPPDAASPADRCKRTALLVSIIVIGIALVLVSMLLLRGFAIPEPLRHLIGGSGEARADQTSRTPADPEPPLDLGDWGFPVSDEIVYPWDDKTALTWDVPQIGEDIESFIIEVYTGHADPPQLIAGTQSRDAASVRLYDILKLVEPYLEPASNTTELVSFSVHLSCSIDGRKYQSPRPPLIIKIPRKEKP